MCEPEIMEGCENTGGIANHGIAKRRRHEAICGNGTWRDHATVMIDRIGNTFFLATTCRKERSDSQSPSNQTPAPVEQHSAPPAMRGQRSNGYC